MSEVIRTLGLYQPYASLMLHGKIESRWVRKGKKPPFPLGKYLIYSTKKAYKMDEFRFMAGPWYTEAVLRLVGEETRFKLGFGLCVAELVLVEKAEANPLMIGYTYYNYKPDPEYDLWLLHFTAKRIKPFEFKSGKQGVGFVKEEDITKIEYI